MKKEIAVIFDMDGVICHTNPYHSRAFREFFAIRGLAPTEEEFARHMYGKSNGYILSHFLKREISGAALMEMENEKELLFRTIYEPYIEPITGILEFISDLTNHGVKLGIATSAPKANLEMILKKVDIPGKIGSLLASEDVEKHKPDPEVYLSSAINLGVSPEQCVVFEDSFSGVTAALRAGMKVVGVLTSHTKEELPPCDLYVRDYTGLEFDNISSLIY